MVEQTTSSQPIADEIEGIDESGFASGEAFKPTEFFSLDEIAVCRLVTMDNERLQRFGVDTNSQQFKDVFPNGVAALEIGLRGIDNEYAFAPDRIKRFQIPMYNYQGDNFGKQKGERSQLDITARAFERVFGVKPFGKENREKLIGRKARWGQHIDSAVVENSDRTWRWPVPREALPADFQYTGDVRVINARQGSDSSGQSTSAPVGAAMLSSEAALKAVLHAIEGHDISDANGAHQKVLDIAGLPQEYVEQATSRELIRNLYTQEFVAQGEGNKIALTDKGKAVLGEGETVAPTADTAPDVSVQATAPDGVMAGAAS